MTTGKLYPLSQYTNDLTLEANGSYKIYPSKYLLLNNSDLEPSTIQSSLDETISAIVSSASDVSDIDYGLIRALEVDALVGDSWDASAGEVSSTVVDENIQVGSDEINFIQNSLHGGYIYSDINIYIPSTVDTSTIILDEGLSDELDTAESIFGDKTEEVASSITYTHIAIFYDIYSVSSTTSEAELVVTNLLLGIYEILDEDGNPTSTTIITTDDYTNSAHEIVIASRFAISSESVIEGGYATDTATLGTVLANFGELAEQMNNVIYQKYTNLSDIKAYLTEFSNNRKANVPYVLGDGWYVNGKYITKNIDAVELELENYITDLKEADASLQDAIEAIEDALSTETSNRKATDASLLSQIEDNDSDIEELQSSLSTEIIARQNNDIDIRSSISALQSSLDSAIETLEETDASLLSQIEDNDSDIEELQNSSLTGLSLSLESDSGILTLTGTKSLGTGSIITASVDLSSLQISGILSGVLIMTIDSDGTTATSADGSTTLSVDSTVSDTTSGTKYMVLGFTTEDSDGNTETSYVWILLSDLVSMETLTLVVDGTTYEYDGSSPLTLTLETVTDDEIEEMIETYFS